MKIVVARDKGLMARMAAREAGELLRRTVKPAGALVTFAAAPSQDRFLQALSREKNIAWDRVKAFHMDEYLDLPDGHPNTFKAYLSRHVLGQIPLPAKNLSFIKDMRSRRPEQEYARIFLRELKNVRDRGGTYIVFMGIGVNGHIAFNEPGTDLWVDEPFVPVRLDDVSVRQQFDDYKRHPDPDARYASLSDVPRRAVTMSVAALLAADTIVCVVPGRHKAEAVAKAVEGPLTEEVPASLLRLHPDVRLFLDTDAAGRLRKVPVLRGTKTGILRR